MADTKAKNDEKDTEITNCGWVRLSNSGNALKIQINKDTLADIKGYTSKDGSEYIQLIVNVSRINSIIQKKMDVTGISHFS